MTGVPLRVTRCTKSGGGIEDVVKEITIFFPDVLTILLCDKKSNSRVTVVAAAFEREFLISTLKWKPVITRSTPTGGMITFHDVSDGESKKPKASLSFEQSRPPPPQKKGRFSILHILVPLFERGLTSVSLSIFVHFYWFLYFIMGFENH